MYALLRLIISLTVALAACGTTNAESFRFWPNEGASKAPGFKRMWEHPCGEVAEADVKKLPLNGPLVSDLVVELNRHGKVVRRWPQPVDFVLHAIMGDELLVRAGTTGYWIRRDGSFRRASPIPPAEQALVKCDLSKVFGESAYARCSVLTDLATGKKRRLGFQGVCT